MKILKKKRGFLKMSKFIALIFLISFFLVKLSFQSKIYKIEFENKLEFNAKHLQAVIADVWDINK